jgi:hypothetical protein
MYKVTASFYVVVFRIKTKGDSWPGTSFQPQPCEISLHLDYAAFYLFLPA